jgi:hypothetical protein
MGWAGGSTAITRSTESSTSRRQEDEGDDDDDDDDDDDSDDECNRVPLRTTAATGSKQSVGFRGA